MLKIINTTAYLKLEDELFFFRVDESTCEQFKDYGLFERIKRIHIFVTEQTESFLIGVAKLIFFSYHDIFAQDCSKIVLYCPKLEICDDLQLQQISSGWYNFFINLWDEIYIDGLQKPVEYMFYEDEIEKKKNQKQQWDIEFIVPKLSSFYYCTNHPRNPISRGIIYDYFFFVINGENDYDTLQQLTESNLGLRGRCYIVSLPKGLEEGKVIERGFHIATKEE